MFTKISTTSTSQSSVVGGEDIVLRENTSTRFLFRPKLVNNIHDENAAVRGNFIFQKK
ncbi:hypothetical protein [Bacillus sp. LK2]|uniref:hypothetical protein n=1 Tax=Bacillus sp. LK2 TaxID=1628206 RepID=UPI000A89D887